MQRAFNWLCILAVMLVLSSLLVVIWGAPDATGLRMIGTAAVALGFAVLCACIEANKD